MEHGGLLHLIVVKGARLLRERQAAGEHDGVAFITFGDHLEEYVGNARINDQCFEVGTLCDAK